MPSVTETGLAGRASSIPDSVRALDALLNARVVEARSEAELHARLREKQTIKRAIVALPDALIEGAAQVWLARLMQTEDTDYAAA